MAGDRAAVGGREAWRVEVSGTVQGVGFRPFVYRTATALGLDGWVRNVDGHVLAAAAGTPGGLREFVARCRDQAPPLAVVAEVTVGQLDPGAVVPGSGFAVLDSVGAGEPSVREVPVDAAVCAECLRELFDPADRRHRYPFTNCTACGPRATVITDLPYDRERTTMRDFPLCAACAAQYADPQDRRFHAEPLACPDCGPRLSWWSPASTRGGEEALRAAVRALIDGAVVAVKGVGGYQLVCDATSDRAVAGLRRRKRRPDKPFAVLVPDLDAALRLARLGDAERALLASAARPVTLVPARGRSSGVAAGVHPGTGRVGVLLPASPLHHLLSRDVGRPLVCTSGNLAGEPIVIDDAEARERLGPVADGFLGHDRAIHSRCDDSVVCATDRGVLTVRRARGYAPAPLRLPLPSPVPLVAVGAQLKHTFTLVSGDRAVIGPHLGDLQDAGTADAFERAYGQLSRLCRIDPQVVVHDLHPGYLSTQWAARWPAGRRVAVQHHHAHVAACAAEHGLPGPFVGVALDGLGFGDDGTLWGGEVLVCDLAGYRRAGRFATAPLPGGAAAVRAPGRMALGYLLGAEDLGSPAADPALVDAYASGLGDGEARAVREVVERGVNCPRASSAGRLFDAAASILGLRHRVSYEGQAAVALEAAAGDLRPEPLPWRLVRAADGVWVYDPLPTLTALLRGSADGVPVPCLAAAFHSAVALATAGLVERAVAEGAPGPVCLSGGCFQNLRLLDEVSGRLRGAGLRVLVGRAVPPNDGGVSFGQAAVAAARLGRETP
ncbi:(NiFe) hydrogenase maturation protein HypF [Wenjunlia vitaminophila]|uniref:Carbamoyltransferase n=1 Tax=Wenjunlia vitaminophila TaxID=76728 RepID=A0A0T6LSU7_WENVI|nr:carbamoyltransferase HypF [Wenjunlia vitaminophila]KRV49080.1 (NiFe) hydrogenase maturation protein HypF [Wenjunlia vitaminophila]